MYLEMHICRITPTVVVLNGWQITRTKTEAEKCSLQPNLTTQGTCITSPDVTDILWAMRIAKAQFYISSTHSSLSLTEIFLLS